MLMIGLHLHLQFFHVFNLQFCVLLLPTVIHKNKIKFERS